MPRLESAVLAALALAVLASCSGPVGGPALVWTDVPELAIAVELYDALPPVGIGPGSRSVELQWKQDLAASLPEALGPAAARARPALVIGRRLAESAAAGSFASLDRLLGKDRIGREAFYPSLLAAGSSGGRQLLLPISFNLPLIVFAKGTSVPGDGFTLSLREMFAPASAFNRLESGAYARMGFSPRWNSEFLADQMAEGGSFRSEGKKLSWNDEGLAAAIGEIIDWVSRANRSATLEDDFQFKYLFAPPYRYLKEGRAMFGAMSSSAFFLAPEEGRAALDFRWYLRSGRATADDSLVWAGLVRDAPGRKGAEAFLLWLLDGKSQRAILERSRRARSLAFSFGVAGGFSSIRSVNEEILPAFFPALVGHALPADLVSAPPVLPADWPGLLSSVIEPWAERQTAAAKPLAADALGKSLSEAVSEYGKARN
jgi:hypothetical protein